MAPKTLLVLAASAYQLEAIAAARALGLRIVTVDNRPDNPGHRFADACHHASTVDREAILAIARREEIAGILAPCTDVAIPTLAYVAERLGLPGPSAAAAEICCDKTAFRRFQRESGLPHPQYVSLRPDATVPAIDFSRPWIVKPDRSSGSKGVFILKSPAELEKRLEESRSFSPTGTVVLEQFLPGAQGTMEGILADGSIRWSMSFDRETAPPPFAATKSHRTPSRFSPAVIADLRRQLETMWGALGVSSGPFDCDFVATEAGAVILEASPRLGGNGISKLIKAAANFDLPAYAVRHAMGEAGDIPSEGVGAPAAVYLFGAESSGRLRYSEREAETLRHEPWMRELRFDYPVGTAVPAFQNGQCRVGAMILEAASRDELDARIDLVRRRLDVRAEPAAEGDAAA
ncbi:MAG TPA: ATP-grasp domain-containing protein [Planctomycetia bacterium]|nr:ATP-grasp domain-containing protein [Planctomycetia bacterium]